MSEREDYKKHIVKEWLFVVDIDLKTAVLTYKGGLFSSTQYHSQQAAEKSLKAYLAFQRRKI